jgi:ATP-dependent DNA helicase
MPVFTTEYHHQGFSSTIMDQLKRALEARNVQTTEQPKLVTGGKMRDYQLEGLTWLTCLYQIGLNGILADEMGLGKTVQLISFLAFLREQGTNGPFLILGPLSTVQNWVNEFARWTPKIPVIMYHGSPQTRAKLRRESLKGDARGPKFPVVCTSYEICMRDKKYLSTYAWKLIVVVSDHRG